MGNGKKEIPWSKLKKKDKIYGPGGARRKNPTTKREAHTDAATIEAKPHANLSSQVAALEKWVKRLKKKKS